MNREKRKFADQTLWAVAAVVVIVAGMRAASGLLLLLLVSGFLSVMLAAPMQWLRDRRVPTAIALGLIFSVICLLVALVASIVSSSVNDFARRVPTYQVRLRYQIQYFEAWMAEQRSHLLQWTELAPVAEEEAVEEEPTTPAAPESPGDLPGTKHGQDPASTTDATHPSEPGVSSTPDLAPSANESVDEPPADETLQWPDEPPPSAVEPVGEKSLLPLTPATSPPSPVFNYEELFDPNFMLALIRRLLGQLGWLLSNAFLILVTVIFMLLEASRMPEKLRAAWEPDKIDLEQFRTIVTSIRRYMGIKTATSLLTGCLVVLLLMILGVNYPLAWGLLAFLLNYIPNIGSIVAAVPAVMLALLQLGFGTAAITAMGYLAINCGIGFFLEPRVMGQGLGLSTLVVFLSLLFWGWVLGPVGVLLSAPLTMILKIVLDNFDNTKWIAVLLSSRAP